MFFPCGSGYINIPRSHKKCTLVGSMWAQSDSRMVVRVGNLFAGPLILFQWISMGSLYHFLFIFSSKLQFYLGPCPIRGLPCILGVCRDAAVYHWCELTRGVRVGHNSPMSGLLSLPSAVTWVSPLFLAFYLLKLLPISWWKRESAIQIFTERNLKVFLSCYFILGIRKHI